MLVGAWKGGEITGMSVGAWKGGEITGESADDYARGTQVAHEGVRYR